MRYNGVTNASARPWKLMSAPPYYIPEEETLDPAAIAHLQRQKLGTLLARILPGNVFYQRKFAGIEFDASRDPLDRLPFTTRQELELDQAEHAPYGTNLSFAPNQYS